MCKLLYTFFIYTFLYFILYFFVNLLYCNIKENINSKRDNETSVAVGGFIPFLFYL